MHYLNLGGAFRDPIPTGDANARIVGGTPADVGAYPWQLSLELRQLGFFWSHICGAVLINQDTALTAAHCVERQVKKTRLETVHYKQIYKGMKSKDLCYLCSQNNLRKFLNGSSRSIFSCSYLFLVMVNSIGG